MGSIPIGSSKKHIGDNMENKESFVELYTRLYNENFNELESLREKEKSRSIKIILAMIGVFISFVIFPFLGIVLFILLIAIIIKNSIKDMKRGATIAKTHIVNGEEVSSSILQGEQSYEHVFKEKIITPIINHVFPDAKYTPDIGIRESEYIKGRWEGYDRYSSEDKIITDISIKDNPGKKLSFTLAEVHTENEHEDDEGHKSYSTVFHGLAGQVDMPKDIGCYIKIVKNGLNWFGGPKDRIEMDMTEFEKMFDVKTDDKIKTMQILTVDIMSELMDLVNTTKVKFELYINHDTMHVRFHTGGMFEPDVFAKSMQLDKLKKCFDKISAVKNVTEHICNVVYGTEL